MRVVARRTTRIERASHRRRGSDADRESSHRSVVVNSEAEIASLLRAFPRVSGHGPTGGLLGSGGGGDDDDAAPVEMVRLKNRFAKPTSSGWQAA